MSKPWAQVALSEIAEPVSRSIPVQPGTPYRTIGVKWWGGGAYERETIDGAQTAAKTLSIVKSGDLIINKIWVRHGSTAIATESVDGCAASGEFPTFTLNQKLIEPRWLYWLTQTRSFWDDCAELSRGTSGKNRIKPELFLTIRIPLPPLAEQRRILARIEELAAMIEEACGLRRQAVEAAEAFITSLHTKLSGSRIKKLSDILRLEEDSAQIIPTGSYPQVGVRGFGGGLFTKPATSGMDTTYRTYNRLYESALVMSQVKAWEGAVAVCEKNLAGYFVSPEYRTFRFDPSEALPSYFAAIVKTEWFWSRLKDATRGVGARRERTRPEQFLNIEIPVPEVVLQKEAAKIFEKISVLKRLQTETAAELNAMLPSILDKAFRGAL